MKNKNVWDLPHILKPELINLQNRLNNSVTFVENHKNDIHPSITFIQAVEICDM